MNTVKACPECGRLCDACFHYGICDGDRVKAVDMTPLEASQKLIWEIDNHQEQIEQLDRSLLELKDKVTPEQWEQILKDRNEDATYPLNVPQPVQPQQQDMATVVNSEGVTMGGIAGDGTVYNEGPITVASPEIHTPKDEPWVTPKLESQSVELDTTNFSEVIYSLSPMICSAEGIITAIAYVSNIGPVLRKTDNLFSITDSGGNCYSLTVGELEQLKSLLAILRRQ